MTGAGVLVALAALIVGQQDEDRIVRESELAPPGEEQAESAEPEPRQPSGQDQDPAQTGQAEPAEPSAQPTSQEEAEDVRRPNERPQPGRRIAAFWFVVD